MEDCHLLNDNVTRSVLQIFDSKSVLSIYITTLHHLLLFTQFADSVYMLFRNVIVISWHSSNTNTNGLLTTEFVSTNMSSQ